MVHGAGNTRLQGNTELPEIVSDVQDALAGVAKKVRRSPTSTPTASVWSAIRREAI